MAKIQVPELTIQMANDITKTAMLQLQTSRRYKMQRMQQIKESEDLYFGIVEKQIRNPFNDCYPFMAGFVDYLEAKIDDVPSITFGSQDQADYKRALKTTALLRTQMKSHLPNAKWNQKDRWSKKLAIFSGVGTFKFYAESDPMFKTCLSVVDHYDFHSEPGGGGNLEDHLFCGEEGIFKTKEEIEAQAREGYYDIPNSAKLISRTGASQYKENADQAQQRNNRHRAFGLDPESNNYTGQDVYKLVEWYLVYKGVRYYCLFDETSGIWLRVKPLRELYSIIEPMNEALWPYVCWHTHEEARIFWSKAPADDARSVAKNINRLINQEMYNREKRNMGQRGYDPTMFHDLEALADTRPDGLVPVDTKNGTRRIAEGVFEFKTGELNGTINLVEFLDHYAGQKTGSTADSKGDAPTGKAVGVFFGELKQIEDRLGLYNDSYTEAYADLGLRFRVGLKDHLKDSSVSVKLMGANGIEWENFSSEDLATVRDFDIEIEGGKDSEIKQQQESARKLEGLKMTTTVNPVWKDREILRAVGYDEEALKDAFSLAKPGLKELLSEAAQAEQDFVEGRVPKINRGANAAFMQHLIDFADNLTLADKVKEDAIAVAILKYAQSHAVIAAENEARDAVAMIQEAKIKAGLAGAGGGTGASTDETAAPTMGPSIGQKIGARSTAAITPTGM